MAITILADLDGTLLPRPYNRRNVQEETTNDDSSPHSRTRSSSRPANVPEVVHPNLSDGPAYEPLVRLLDLGATVVGVTGSQLSTHRRRFFDELPLRHRRDGRVMLAVQTGSQLYVGHGDDGRPMRDVAFDSHLSGSISTRFDDDTVNELVGIGRRGLAQFYTDLANDHTLVDRDGPLGYLIDIARKITEKTTEGGNVYDETRIPITDNVHEVPRIEVRGQNSAVVFVGVPSPLGRNYFDVPTHLRSTVDGKPTGRSCYDCVPAGMDKSHVVRYLMRTNVIRRGRTVAIGDQPAGNDAGLTFWHGGSEGRCNASIGSNIGVGSSMESLTNIGEEKKQEEVMVVDEKHHTIPFISVSECPTMVPHRLKDCHISRITNVEGSAKILMELVDILEDERAGKAAAEDASVSLCTRTLGGIVKKVNDAVLK